MIQVDDSAEYGDEAALRAEVELLRRQKAFAHGIFAEIGLGLWSFEMDEGKPPRMYGNPTMDALVGCNGAAITPEEYYLAWYTRVDEAHLHAVQNVVERIIAGELAEVRYPYHHPDRGIIQVVCGGTPAMEFVHDEEGKAVSVRLNVLNVYEDLYYLVYWGLSPLPEEMVPVSWECADEDGTIRLQAPADDESGFYQVRVTDHLEWLDW